MHLLCGMHASYITACLISHCVSLYFTLFHIHEATSWFYPYCFFFSYVGVVSIWYLTAIIVAEFYTGNYERGPIAEYNVAWTQVKCETKFNLHN